MRRTRFAAAWVVIGCSAPAARAPAPSSPAPPPDATVIAIPDAEASIDGGVIADARPPAPTAEEDPCTKPFDPAHPVYCNPPSTAKIVDVQVSNSKTLIVIDQGSDDGVTIGEKGELIGVRKGGFVVGQVARHRCIATVNLTYDQVAGSTLTVRFDL